MSDSQQLAELYDASGETERMLLIARDHELSGVIVRRGLVEGRVLTAVRTRRKVVEFRDLAFGAPRITRENPYVGIDERDHLDEFGIVHQGTLVSSGMIAVSALEPALRGRSAGLPAGHEWVRNRSAEFEPAEHGFVVERVVHENVRQRPADFPRGLIDRVTITLRRNDPLTIGDALRVNGHDVCVFELRDDGKMPTDPDGQPADILVPAKYLPGGGFTVMPVARTLPTAADLVTARDVGQYSLITMQPLGKSSSPGQEVTPTQISWLRRNGFHAIAAEFASLKCDDTINRAATRRFAAGQGELPDDLEPGCPESLHVLTQELRILGLSVEWLSEKRSVSLLLLPATTGWIQNVAKPVINKPDTVNYRTHVPEPGGLFCETAFGPEKSVRRERVAHIELAAPIVPIIFRLGSDPILPRVLGLEAHVIEDVLSGLTGLSRGEAEPVLVRADSDECELRGGEAIRHLLGIANRIERIPDPHSLVHDWVYVCPPDIRPLVLLDSGNWATSDLNDHYRKIVNRNNRLRKLIQLNAPPQILHSERAHLQKSVDELHANCLLPEPALESGRPLKSALDMVLSRMAERRGKPVDWSAIARVLIDDRVGDQDVVVPAKVFDALKCDSPAPLLLSNGARFVACKPLPANEFVIRMSPRVARVLQCATGDECVVHRPLTSPAVDEAQQLLANGLDKDYLPAHVADPPCTEKMLDELVDHVASGRPLDLTSDRWFLLGGSGSLRRLTDDESPQFVPDFRSVPKPPARPVPTIDEILSVIAAEEKTTCLFRIERTEGEPARGEGRIGGRPWLPEGFQWPVVAGRPVPFLAQLPLEPARRAKALPFDVPADSMLSIFWSDDWWESPSAAGSVIFIHGTRDLDPVDPPDGVRARPLCRVLPELKQETPGWSELADVIKTHFGKLPRTLLRDIQENHFSVEGAATEGTRVGGHAHWVQYPERDFVAQIVSDDAAELMFGDCGSLYVLGQPPDGLYGVVQCY